MSELAVPWLRSGVGKTPKDGGCILQVIDWISNGGWTDDPQCVHPVLKRLAIAANDASDDEGRQKLLDLAPRLIGTNIGGNDLSVKLAIFCARSVLHIFEDQYPEDDRPRRAIEAAESRDRAATATAAATPPTPPPTPPPPPPPTPPPPPPSRRRHRRSTPPPPPPPPHAAAATPPTPPPPPPTPPPPPPTPPYAAAYPPPHAATSTC